MLKVIIVDLTVLFWGQNLQSSERLMRIIMSSPSDYYVLQIASIDENSDLDQFIRESKLSKQLVAIKTLVKDKKRCVILEGIYKNKDEADFAANKIRSKDSNISPWPRTIGSLKQVLAIKSL